MLRHLDSVVAAAEASNNAAQQPARFGKIDYESLLNFSRFVGEGTRAVALTLLNPSDCDNPPLWPEKQNSYHT